MIHKHKYILNDTDTRAIKWFRENFSGVSIFFDETPFLTYYCSDSCTTKKIPLKDVVSQYKKVIKCV